MWEHNHTPELRHYGVLGMKWGVRRYQNKDGTMTSAGKRRQGKKEVGYSTTGLKSTLARRANKKVDKGFKAWKENTQKRDNAIELGKKATQARLAYENNKADKSLKKAHQQSDKAYKKALKENTAYRKGVVRSEVGKDLSRKYLSSAKQVKKQLEKNPSDKQLQKKYNSLMSEYNVERAKARRAVKVGTKRSQKIASLKRARTMAIRGAATTAGIYAVNQYLKKTGKGHITSSMVNDLVKNGKKVLAAAGFFY